MANDQSKALAVDVIARVDKLEKAMSKAKKVANDNYKSIETRTGSMVSNVNAKLGSIGKEFAIGLGGGVIAAMAPLALFQKAISDLGDANALKQLSDRIGLSTDSIQALQYAAVQAGVNVDQMGDGLGDFAAKVAEAASGAGQLAPIFKANNVELKKADGTLRSTRDILGDFANLIQNARTPQEQLFLSQQAFGDEASKLVPLFKDGAAGLANLETSAKSAGAVLDSDLVTRAAELDKQFQAMWTTFDVQSKSALLTAVDGIANLRGELSKLGDSDVFKWLNGKLGIDKTPMGANGDAGDAINKMLAGIDGTAPSGAKPKPTIIPAAKSGGSGLKSSVDFAQKMIDNLERQKSLIGASELEIAKSNALWQAGTKATEDQKTQIAGLVEAIYTAKQAHEAQLATLKETQAAARDFAETLVDGFIQGESAAKVLESALKQLASRLLSSGLDMLFGGGSTKGFGLIGDLFGLPKFASGTRNAPGGLALVGERGPELVNLPKGSAVLPSPQTMQALRAPQIPSISARAGGGTVVNVTLAPNIDNRGASAEAVARTQAALAQLKAELPTHVVAAVQKANKSNVDLGFGRRK
jgi:hypothetical protein